MVRNGYSASVYPRIDFRNCLHMEGNTGMVVGMSQTLPALLSKIRENAETCNRGKFNKATCKTKAYLTISLVFPVN